jgi:hypothetical protein
VWFTTTRHDTSLELEDFGTKEIKAKTAFGPGTVHTAVLSDEPTQKPTLSTAENLTFMHFERHRSTTDVIYSVEEYIK